MSETERFSTQITAAGIVLQHDDATATFHALWLRDNCPEDGDKLKAFRTFSVVDLDPELTVADTAMQDGELRLRFSDGHESIFDPGWLWQHRSAARLTKPLAQRSFRADTELPQFSLPAPESAGHCDVLDAVAAWGVAVVNDVPGTEHGTEALAALIGHVRETDFGRLFDIVVEPEAWEFSQTGLALDPHTDDPYRYTPSGTSILHCVEASTEGGDSILVDGFAVASDVRHDDPAAFDLLTSNSVPFVRHRAESVDQGEDVHLLAHAPIIALDRDGEVAGIRYHERSMAPLDLAEDVTGPYYRALIGFTRRINDPANAIRFRLHPGQAIIYDNQRVLHGRTAFGSGGGRRHLRLCTIDRDQFHSRLRRLRADHSRAAPDERLPPGNLS